MKSISFELKRNRSPPVLLQPIIVRSFGKKQKINDKPYISGLMKEDILKNNILEVFILRGKIYEIRNVSDFEAKKVQIFDHETGEAVQIYKKEIASFIIYIATCDKAEPSIYAIAKELKTVFIEDKISQKKFN